MSLAFKCDRCGAVYVPEHIDDYCGVRKCWFRDDLTVDSNESAENWCPKCMSAFAKFKSELDMPYRPTLEEIMDLVEYTNIPGPDYRILKDRLPSLYKAALYRKGESYEK